MSYDDEIAMARNEERADQTPPDPTPSAASVEVATAIVRIWRITPEDGDALVDLISAALDAAETRLHDTQAGYEASLRAQNDAATALLWKLDAAETRVKELERIANQNKQAVLVQQKHRFEAEARVTTLRETARRLRDIARDAAAAEDPDDWFTSEVAEFLNSADVLALAADARREA